MSEQSKECEACFGTCNEARMRSPYPTRKILFRPCPVCKGTGNPLRGHQKYPRP